MVRLTSHMSVEWNKKLVRFEGIARTYRELAGPELGWEQPKALAQRGRSPVWGGQADGAGRTSAGQSCGLRTVWRGHTRPLAFPWGSSSWTVVGALKDSWG